MGQLEGSLSRNSDGSTFGASATGWSPYDDYMNPPIKTYLLVGKGGIAAAYYRTFGDPAYDDEQHLKNRGVW